MEEDSFHLDDPIFLSHQVPCNLGIVFIFQIKFSSTNDAYMLYMKGTIFGRTLKKSYSFKRTAWNSVETWGIHQWVFTYMCV